MCFSAAASFGTSLALALAGSGTLHQTRAARQRPFAAIPLLFAIQQCCEGFVWLGHSPAGPPPWQQVPTYAFLVFALIVWPVWIPLALYQLATAARKRRVGVLVALGCCVAAVLGACLCWRGATAAISGHHIAYTLPYPPAVLGICAVLYGLATIVPPFVCGVRGMGWLGTGIAFAYLVSAYFYRFHVLSVWCYFSALLSVLIYAIQRMNWAGPESPRPASMIPHAA